MIVKVFLHCLFYGEKDGEPSSGPPPLLHTPARPESPRSMPPIYRIWPSPGATKSRLSATATPPRTPCKLRVAHNKDLQARRPRVVCNIQTKFRASGPAAQDDCHQPQRLQPKQIPPRLFSVEKTLQPSPSALPAASNTAHSPIRQSYQPPHPNPTEQRTKKQDPSQP